MVSEPRVRSASLEAHASRHPMAVGPGVPQQGLLAAGLTQELRRGGQAWPPSVQVEALRVLLDGRQLILTCTPATPAAAPTLPGARTGGEVVASGSVPH
jgi:hypothetical protein